MSANLDRLRQLDGEIPTTNPKPGDIVTITGLDGVFTVLSFDGVLFTLRSEHGVQLRAGVLVVRRVEQETAA